MKNLFTVLAVILISSTVSCSKDDGIAEFNLVVGVTEGGSVNTSGGTYDENTTVSITATPIEGYFFTGWTGDATGNENPLSVTITGNVDITANFLQYIYLSFIREFSILHQPLQFGHLHESRTSFLAQLRLG